MFLVVNGIYVTISNTHLRRTKQPKHFKVAFDNAFYVQFDLFLLVLQNRNPEYPGRAFIRSCLTPWHIFDEALIQGHRLLL